jgi:[ribosomal protein S18]-alanine N-acetyltransferase
MTMTSDEILIRWAIRRDFDRIMEIERASYDEPWTESEMLDYVRSKTGIAMVACVGDQVVGSILYDRQPDCFQVDAVSVDPSWRREGIGSAMVTHLARKTGPNGKRCCSTMVRESNLGALSFFRSLGFIATELVCKPYSDRDEDGYRLVYERVSVRRILANRISR